MCIHGFVKFMQNLCSDLKVLRRIQGGIAGGGRRKRHHTFFFQINLQVNSKFFFQKKYGASSCWLAILPCWICAWQHKSSLDMIHQITTCRHASMIPLASCIII